MSRFFRCTQALFSEVAHCTLGVGREPRVDRSNGCIASAGTFGNGRVSNESDDWAKDAAARLGGHAEGTPTCIWTRSRQSQKQRKKLDGSLLVAGRRSGQLLRRTWDGCVDLRGKASAGPKFDFSTLRITGKRAKSVACKSVLRGGLWR